MWPQMNLKSGIAKAVVEQFTYGPMAGVSFFTCMTLMEGKGFKEVCSEVKEKFPRTYQGSSESFLLAVQKFSRSSCLFVSFQLVSATGQLFKSSISPSFENTIAFLLSPWLHSSGLSSLPTCNS